MPTLLDLPPEILQSICCQFCHHCTNEPPASDPALTNDRQDAPLHLSRVCKTLSIWVQPVLYHQISCPPNQMAKLVMTLGHRKDLAAVVNSLTLCGEKMTSSISEAEAQAVGEIMARFPCPEPISPHWYLQLHESKGIGLTEGLFQCQPMGLLRALAMALVPNVTCIELTMAHDVEHTFCQPGSLPYLNELELQQVWANGIHVSQIEPMMQAAPALKILHCYGLYGQSENIPENCVEELALYTAELEPRDLRNMLLSLKSINKLVYKAEWHSANEPTPRAVALAMMERSDSLRHVNIHLPFACEEYGRGGSEGIVDLKMMEALEILVLDGGAIYTAGVEEPDTDGTLLLGLLPPSIRIFTINDPHPEIHQDILQLAEKAPERFPKLKEVNFTNMNRWYWALSDISALPIKFSSQGIKCKALVRDSDEI